MQEGGEEGNRREDERRREEEEEETFVLQFAAIKLCKFAVIRENLSIFAVIKKKCCSYYPPGRLRYAPTISSMVIVSCD